VYRVGVIGTGDIAMKAYLPVLATRSDVEIVGLASRTASRAESLAKQYRLGEICGSLSQLLDKRPDIVFVHASTTAHSSIVLECLQADIPVYVDKPLSESLDEVRHLAQEASQRQLLLAVGFNRRFAPLVRQAVNFVGEPTHLIAQKHRMRPQARPARETLYDDLIHVIDLLCWASESSIELDAGCVVVDDLGQLQVAAGLLQRNGVVGQFSMSREGGADSETFSLFGREKSATVAELEEVSLYSGGHHTVKGFGSWDSALYRRGFVDLIQHVLESISSPNECEVSATAVLPTHELVEKLCKLGGV
jgi:virulence factor